MDRKIRVLYRMNVRCGRIAPEWFSNRSCFLNLISSFPSADIYSVLDNADDSCVCIMEDTQTPYESTSLGNPGAYNRLLDIVEDRVGSGEYGRDDIIYFVENDYCHRPGSESALLDAMSFSDYVTLYDHPDKYDVSHYCDGLDYSDIRSQLFIRPSGYWRTTTSTCMTYATTAGVLLEDIDIHRNFSRAESGGGNIGMYDYKIFHTLTKDRNRSLVSPLPGYATHGDMLSPYIDWEEMMYYSQPEAIKT
jgi:hypothetical protein